MTDTVRVIRATPTPTVRVQRRDRGVRVQRSATAVVRTVRNGPPGPKGPQGTPGAPGVGAGDDPPIDLTVLFDNALA